MKYLPILLGAVLLVAKSPAQQPDSTVMNVTVGNGAGVPTTTIIPVAQPPIQEVDTTYVRITPPDSTGHRHQNKRRNHQYRDSLRGCHTKQSPSNHKRSDRLNN